MSDPKPAKIRAMTNAQLKRRRVEYLGGTDVAAIMGINPFKTPADVYLEKLGFRETVENPVMRLGHWLEKPVADHFSRTEGKKLVRVDTAVHATLFFLAGNMDRKVEGESKGAEIKTFGSRAAAYWGEPGTDEVPKNYHIQAAWYGMLYDLEVVYIVALNKETGEIHVYVIERDKDLEKLMTEYAVRFWRNNVEQKIRPMLDDSERAARLVMELYPTDDGGIVYADEQINLAVATLQELHDWESSIEKEIRAIQTQLKDHMGTNSSLVTSIGDFTWRKPKDSLVCEKDLVIEGTRKLLANDPERLELFEGLIELHTHTKENSRRFLAPWSRRGGRTT